MKFIHLGDLHFGKMLYNVPLVEEDQPFWAEQLLKAVDELGVDAVVIAGDVYDRKNPAPEAMQLFAHLMTELKRRDKYVLVIPGNHDSEVRLSHYQELLTAHKIYIAGELHRELDHVTVGSGADAVTFWLMPYIFPKLVADERVLNTEEPLTYDAAARALIAAQDLDPAACNVLIAHQNVLANGVAPEHSESETIIGGLGEIEVSAFEAFDYVALGHIHNAQKIGRETARYSGCPLYYDFSELKRRKALTVVTVNSKEDIKVELVDIPLRHKLLQLSGTLESLLEQGMALPDKDAYYIQCVLQDKHVPSRAIDQLKDVFGASLVNVKRELPEGEGLGADGPDGEGLGAGNAGGRRLGLKEQFGLFFQELNDELLDGGQEDLLDKLLEQQSRGAGEYHLDAKTVPEKESEELLAFLMKENGRTEDAGGKTKAAAGGAEKAEVEA